MPILIAIVPKLNPIVWNFLTFNDSREYGIVSPKRICNVANKLVCPWALLWIESAQAFKIAGSFTYPCVMSFAINTPEAADIASVINPITKFKIASLGILPQRIIGINAIKKARVGVIHLYMRPV